MRTTKPRITVRTNPAGSISYCVDAGTIEGKRYRKFFASKEDAKQHAKQVLEAKRQQGALAFRLSPKQQVEAAAAFERLASHGSLFEAVEYFLKHTRPRSGHKTVRDLVTELLNVKTRRGAKPRYLRALRFAYDRFCAAFGERNINEVRRSEIEEWVHAQSCSALTKGNYIRDLHMLFKFAAEEGYCAENAVARIEKPKALENPIEIFSVGEASSLLFAAHTMDAELVPYIAIGLFAGLRSSELESLDWDEINLHQRTILVTAAKAKTAKRRIVHVSDNLHAWLLPYQKMEGSLVMVGWRDRLQKLIKEAELKPRRNGLRHSFGSYHLAFHQDAAKTALEMGHETTRMLFAHYRELVSQSEAARYWNIQPPTSFFMPAAVPVGEDSNVIVLNAKKDEAPKARLKFRFQ
jgi:integrase